VYSLPNGAEFVRATVAETIPADGSSESKAAAVKLGQLLAEKMRAQGAQAILDQAHQLTRGTNINAAPIQQQAFS
jgi:hypothetical protein